MHTFTISKSLFKAYQIHPKLAWWAIHDRPRYNWINTQLYGSMGGAESGAAVEEQVLQLYPDTPLTRIPVQWAQPGGTIDLSQQAIRDKKPLIAQACLTDGELLCVVDLLRLNPDGTYDLIEVKSKSSIRNSTRAATLLDELIADLSFQRYVARRVLGDAFSGRCYLNYVNKEYIREGAVDPRQLILEEDVSSELQENDLIASQLKTLQEDVQRSEQDLHARYPYDGELYQIYYGADPPVGSVWTIPGSVKKLSGRIREGLVDILEMDEEDIRLLYKADGSESTQSNYVRLFQDHEIYSNHAAIRQILDNLPRPFYFYDYETISSPVPLLDGTRPNQQVVVQFSLHELPILGGDTAHYEGIIGPGERTNRRVIEELIHTTTGKEGTYIVWNKSFEMARNRELMATYPEFARELERINASTFDLMEIFKNLHYFDRRFNGSFSIKAILPVLTPITYENLNVQKGDQAANLLAGIISGTIQPKEAPEIQRQLLEYCQQDTWAMVEIYRILASNV